MTNTGFDVFGALSSRVKWQKVWKAQGVDDGRYKIHLGGGRGWVRKYMKKRREKVPF